MNDSVRMYSAAGRATTQWSSDRGAGHYSPDMRVFIIQEPGEYACRIQIGDGTSRNAIKFQRITIEKIMDALHQENSYESVGNGRIHAGKINGKNQRSVQSELISVTIEPFNDHGLRIQMGEAETQGAEAFFTPKQRTDFEQVMTSFQVGQNGFTPLLDNSAPQIVAPNGSFTPFDEPEE